MILSAVVEVCSLPLIRAANSSKSALILARLASVALVVSPLPSPENKVLVMSSP